MPTYEYTCKTCGSNFEVHVKCSEKSKIRCPKCEGKELQEIFGFNTTKSGSSAASIPCNT